MRGWSSSPSRGSRSPSPRRRGRDKSYSRSPPPRRGRPRRSSRSMSRSPSPKKRWSPPPGPRSGTQCPPQSVYPGIPLAPAQPPYANPAPSYNQSMPQQYQYPPNPASSGIYRTDVPVHTATHWNQRPPGPPPPQGPSASQGYGRHLRDDYGGRYEYDRSRNKP